MKVRSRDRGKDLIPITIYWADRLGSYQMICFAMSKANYRDMAVFLGDELEVLDGSMREYELVRKESGEHIIVHNLALELGLVDRLTEYDDGAMSLFREKVRLMEAGICSRSRSSN